MKTIVNYAFLLACAALASSTSFAQARKIGVEAQVPIDDDSRPGQAPDTNAGTIGQRQTRESAASRTGVEPIVRIDNRVANRVQSRVRSRVDRNYDPNATAKSPFEVSAERMRTLRR